MPTYSKTRVQDIEVVKPKNPKAPWVIDDMSLAFLLGVRGQTLWNMTINHAKHYKVFRIPKASGRGERLIHSPSDRLKAVQKLINFVILDALQEDLGPHVAAYRRGRSMVDAWYDNHHRECATCDAQEGPAPKHDCPRAGVKVKMDIKDFFNTTKRSTIRNYFKKSVGYSHMVSDLLATLMTVPILQARQDRSTFKRNVVPQGAPTSGAICNLVADWKLDQPILAALDKWNEDHGYTAETGWKYTRYADDLALSHSENLSREDVDEVLGIVMSALKKTDWKINRKKTKVLRPHRRQKFLGMSVNVRPNPVRSDYRRMRALLHNALVEGWESQMQRSKFDTVGELQAHVQGVISYYKSVNENKAAKLSDAYDAVEATCSTSP